MESRPRAEPRASLSRPRSSPENYLIKGDTQALRGKGRRKGDWLSDALKKDNPACYPLHLLLKTTKAQDPLSMQVTGVPECAIVFKPLRIDSIIL